MRAKLIAVLGLTGLLIQGCAEKPQAVQMQEPADEAGHAAKCDVTPNPVVLHGADAVKVAMTVGNDGGWCAVRMAQSKTAILRQPPEHGKPYFRNVRDISRLQYYPAAGFAGTDSFTFQMIPSGALVKTTVTVTAP